MSEPKPSAQAMATAEAIAKFIRPFADAEVARSFYDVTDLRGKLAAIIAAHFPADDEAVLGVTEFRAGKPSKRALAAGTVIAVFTYPADGPRAIPKEHAAYIIDQHVPAYDELLEAASAAIDAADGPSGTGQSEAEIIADNWHVAGPRLRAAIAKARR